jgi:hypothetical protein
MTPQHRAQFSDALGRMAGEEKVLLKVASIVVQEAPHLVRFARDYFRNPTIAEPAKSIYKLKCLLATFQSDAEMAILEDIYVAIRERDFATAKTKWSEGQETIAQTIESIEALLIDRHPYSLSRN